MICTIKDTRKKQDVYGIESGDERQPYPRGMCGGCVVHG